MTCAPSTHTPISRLVLLGFALLLGYAGQVRAGVLLGLSTAPSTTERGKLYTINPATGAATLVTPISGSTSIVGLEYLNGQLFASDVNLGGGWLGTVDVQTGQFSPVVRQDSNNWQALAGSAAQGLLYTVDITDGNKLKSITPGGDCHRWLRGAYCVRPF